MSRTFRYELALRQDQGDRSDQQDAAGFTSPNDPGTSHRGVLAALADGMGGLSHGFAAAQLVVETFRNAYCRKRPEDSIPALLIQALHETNAAVLDLARRASSEGKTGATLAAAVIVGRELYWISSGDSRAYLARDKRLFRLTVDHTLEEDFRFEARPMPQGHHPEAVTSFMGMPVTARWDANVRAFEMLPGDIVVLASDGLYRTLDEAIIAQILSSNLSLQLSCDTLVERAVGRRAPEQDNLTILAMRAAE